MKKLVAELQRRGYLVRTHTKETQCMIGTNGAALRAQVWWDLECMKGSVSESSNDLSPSPHLSFPLLVSNISLPLAVDSMSEAVEGAEVILVGVSNL